MTTISKRIKKCRLEAGMTQQYVADKLGVLKQQIYNYERGINVPPVERMLKMAKLFKKSMNWLTTGKETNNSSKKGIK